VGVEVEGRIGPHRTLVTLPLSRSDAVGALALSLGFTAGGWLVAPYMFAMWRWMFTTGSAALDLGGRVEIISAPTLSTSVPVLAVASAAPGRMALIVGALAAVALIIVSQRFVASALPMTYFIRAVALVLASAVIVFGVGAPNAPDLTMYSRAMLRVSVGIWLMIPLVYGVTLFLLDIGWTRKAALIAAAMAHLALFIPVQQLVAMYLVRHLTLLALPLVFVFGSVVPQIAVLIALYAWGASWPERKR
jgi:hypothetical protein